MTEARDKALWERRMKRAPNRCNPDTEFTLGFDAGVAATARRLVADEAGTDYEAIYSKASRENMPGPLVNAPAGIAAVVAAAKREALEEAADAYEVDPDVTYFPKIVGRWLRQRAGVPE